MPTTPPTTSSCTRAVARHGTSALANPGPEPEDDDPLLNFEPYLHVQPRSNAITPDRQRRFIATLAATGIVSQAARSIGKSLEALYKLKHKPGAEGFAAAWDAALERGVQRLEDCALQRAVQGTPTPIVSGGKLIGTWDRPDNNLLRFLLQRRLPRIYAPQTISPGDPIYKAIKKQVLLDDMIDRERNKDKVKESILRKLAAFDEQRWEQERAVRDREVAEEHAAPPDRVRRLERARRRLERRAAGLYREVKSGGGGTRKKAVAAPGDGAARCGLPLRWRWPIPV